MRRLVPFLLVWPLSILGIASAADNAKLPLRVLYLARDGETIRREVFTSFLQERFEHVVTLPRRDFQTPKDEKFDVVLLDWAQDEDRIEQYPSPLGKLESWSVPTVLLGSAGLLIAGPWQTVGGAGCTCLSPYAYGLGDHEITRGPIAVDRSQATDIDTPKDWQHAIKDAKVSVLPLLVNEGANRSRHGWCTYTYEHAQAPELELICGGINAKTPLAGAIWRQGHLLHFGFEESPDQLNQNGRAILVNSICYIAKFSEDRPIIRTPSPSYSKIRILDRNAIGRAIDRPEIDLKQYVIYFMAPELQTQIEDLDRAGLGKWFDEVRPYIHANELGKLTIDQTARELGIAPNQMEFFPQAFKLLDQQGSSREQAIDLLRRYAPELSEKNIESPDGRQRWWNENRNYLFFSDTGGYRWYLDPLAKKRGVPTSELRGSDRTTSVQLADPTQNDSVIAGSAVSRAKAKWGDEITISVRIRIAEGWHIYDTDLPTGFGSATKLELELPKQVQPIAEWTHPTPTRKSVNGAEQFVYRGDVTFSRRLKVESDADVGTLTIRCLLAYQACDEALCFPLKRIPLSANIEIVPE